MLGGGGRVLWRLGMWGLRAGVEVVVLVLEEWVERGWKGGGFMGVGGKFFELPLSPSPPLFLSFLQVEATGSLYLFSMVDFWVGLCRFNCFVFGWGVRIYI